MDTVTFIQLNAVKNWYLLYLSILALQNSVDIKSIKFFIGTLKSQMKLLKRDCLSNLGIEFVEKLRKEFRLAAPTKYQKTYQYADRFH